MNFKSNRITKYLIFIVNKLIYKCPAPVRLFVLIPFKSRLIIAEFMKRYNESQKIKLYYDTSISPPTYGDFLNLVMLGRFFALSGKTVRIQILDTGPRKGVYNIDLHTHRVILTGYMKIARDLLPKNTEIEVTKKLALRNDEITFNSRVVFHHAPKIMQILNKHYAWEIPSNFFLSGKTKSSTQPYIAWGLRHGRWSEKRNAEFNEILSDYRTLRHFFPKHRIMVLTTKDGWSKYKKVLEQADRMANKELNSKKIICQPVFGFYEAMNFLLGADFYFHRKGSGLGTVANYSDVPYLIIANEHNYECNFFQKSYVSINNENQKFKVIKHKNKNFSIYSELNKLVKANSFIKH
jgi:hypothetical protein